MDIYELIGFYIGDGNIYYSKEKRKYRLEFCGNSQEDMGYFQEINNFLVVESQSVPQFFTRDDGHKKSVRIQLNNKSFVEKFLSYGFLPGKKTFTIKIPDELLTNKEIMVSIIRGLFEADGCLYFSKSKKIDYPSYPRLEIQTSSQVLVDQIKNFLEKEGFIFYIKKRRNGRTFAITLSGERMLEKWRDLIGFVSEKNTTKYGLWKAKGFYIPHTPLKSRKDLCAGGTTVLRPISS